MFWCSSKGSNAKGGKEKNERGATTIQICRVCKKMFVLTLGFGIKTVNCCEEKTGYWQVLSRIREVKKLIIIKHLKSIWNVFVLILTLSQQWSHIIPEKIPTAHSEQQLFLTCNMRTHLWMLCPLWLCSFEYT